MKQKRPFKRNRLLLLILVIISLFLGIGYAQISNVKLEIIGDATLEAEKKVVITEIKYVSSNNAIENQSTIGEPYLTIMNSTITLGNSLNSTIKYKIKVKNNSELIVKYNNAIYSVEQGYDNENISFVIDGISPGDILNPKETKEFTITFKYADGITNADNNVLNSIINFKFDNDDKIAKIGENYYDTLQEAIEAVPKNDSETIVELLKDTSEALTISANQNINFILYNYTISNSGDNPVIENKGTIKISDGIITTSDLTKTTINNNSGANLVIDGVTIITSLEEQAIHNLENGTINIISGTIIGTKQQAISNEGVINIGIKDGQINNSAPIIQGETYGIVNSNILNFYDGNIKGITDAISGITTDIETNLGNNTESINDKNYKVLYNE